MKKLFICLLSLLSISLLAQQEENKFTPDRVGLSISPEWAGDYAVFTNSLADQRTNMNLGLNISANVFYELGKRSVLNIGLGYSYRGYEIKDMTITPIILDENWNLDTIYTLTGEEQYKWHNLTIPINLYLEYGQYNNSPLFFYTSFGTELNFLLLREWFLDYHDNPEDLPDIREKKGLNSTTKPYHILINIGAGLGYQFNERAALRVEPNFKVNIGNNPLDPFPMVFIGDYEYAWGIRAMFTYRLKERKER